MLTYNVYFVKKSNETLQKFRRCQVTGIRPIHLNISEHKMLGFSVRTEIIENNW